MLGSLKQKMVCAYREQLGICLVVASFLVCRVASQSGCSLQKNVFIIDVTLTEGRQGDSNNYEKRFLGFAGTADTIKLDVEQDDPTVDFYSNFRIFIGIADFNHGYLIQRTGPVDRDGPTSKYSDDNNILEYTIVCTELNTTNKYYYPLLIRIQDLNDNPPAFRNEPFEISVNRATVLGATLTRLVATDKDIDRNRHVVYGIQKGSGELNDASQYFQFAVISSGALSLKKNINIDAFKREGITSMTLNIFAMDMGVKSLRTDSSVKVNINYDGQPIEKEEAIPVARDRTPTTTTVAPVFISGNCELVEGADFADGRIKVKLPEVISESDLNDHPSKYRTFIGIENKVTNLRLEPQSNLVQIDYLSNGQRAGYYIRFTEVVDRDNSQHADDGIHELNFNLTCMYGNRFVIYPLHIFVSDVNDNSPVIEGSDFQFELYDYFKESDLPVVVYELYDHAIISDADSGVNNLVSFGIVPGNGGVLDASRYFVIENGDISLTSPVDYNTLKSFGSTTLFINVSVSDSPKHENQRRTSYQIVEATILRSTTLAPPTTLKPTAGCKLTDEPSFIGGNIHITMPEANTASELEDNSAIYTKYIGLDDGVQLSMISDGGFNPDSYFQLIAQNGQQYLTMIQPIDRDGSSVSENDDTNMVEFTIKCKETGASLYFPIRVDIGDINDNAPQFEDSPYLLNVNERASPGEIVYGSLSATDKDSGDNGDIIYAIAPGDGSSGDISSYFNINPASGEIILTRPLDFESLPTQTFLLNITASDSAPSDERRTSYTSLEITISDSDDQGPMFVYDTCLTSSGVCNNPRYTTSIESGIVSGTLSVFPVPANKQNTNVNIIARDQDSLNHPILFTVDQSIPDGYVDYFTVETSGPTDDAEYTARISQVKIVKRSDVRKLKLFIKATEISAQSRSARAEVDVTVEQTNLNPPSVSTASGSLHGYIRENDPIGTFVSSGEDDTFNVLKIVATDPDVSPNDPPQVYEYSLEPSSVFKIDNQGRIQTIARLDYEAVPTYRLAVTVTEADTEERRQATVTLTVDVKDVNDNAPTFREKSVQFNITEGDYSTGPRTLGTVVASDADSGEGGEVTYSILDVRPDEGDLFEIDSNTGVIKATGALTPDTVYNVRVQAVDNGNPPRSSVMVVQIISEAKPNRQPSFSQSHYKIAVRENQKVNSQLLELSASDPDGDALTYSITRGNLGQTFAIDENFGIVSIAKELDYESVKSYLLTITSTDPKGLEASADIKVDIIDSNDNAPVFSSSIYEVGVIEGDYSGAPKVVVQVMAQDDDSDENSQIDYSIIKMNPDEAGKVSVDPNNGELEIVGQIVGGVTYTLTVEASDAGNPPKRSTAKVIISVIPVTVANNPPVIPQSEYKVSVSEGTAVASEIVKISAMDPDGDDLTYRIINQNPATSTFKINQDGVITNVVMLDREMVDEYTLLVEVEDSKELTSETSVVVTVTDMNDNKPQFSHKEYVFSVVEGQKVKYVVAAFDSDEPSSSNSLITYSFLEPVDNFVINQNGEISSKTELDREEQQEYELVVVASDNGLPVLTSTAIVKIKVADVADSVPVFNPSIYEVFIPEGKADYHVVTVSASDADDTKNVVYVFGDGDTSDFTLDSITGEIRTRKALNMASKPFYYFIVTTTDGKDVSSATVSVTVEAEELIAEKEHVVSAPILPVDSQPNRTEVVIIPKDLGGDKPPNFKYPTCVGACKKPEYSSSVQSGASLFRLRLFPMPSDNPTLTVPLQARDANTPFNELEFTVVRTVPPGLNNHFTIEREGPDNTGFYRAVIKLIKPLWVDKTPKVQLIVQATEVSSNALYAEATIYIDVERHYILESVPLKGRKSSANTISQLNIFSLLLLTVLTLLFV
ncbi:protocadherin Fat 4 isoform X2 [Patella vulgata]|uniref:protocadherin Fat 4 isoform X2 n=1 Tax=Patella vulgata TaxID=6465 RepID=UPI00218014C8|nr:protocadherin Fat 4 isoform X2 [Patella vulgata]